MGFLTDLWKQFCDFFQIEAVEPIVPESKEPSKPHEPAESVTPLPEKTPAVETVEPIEPLPATEIVEPTPIGEQGRADRIKVLSAKEEPETLEDYPATVDFIVKDSTGKAFEKEGYWYAQIEGANVTCFGQTKITDKNGRCSISGRIKKYQSYPITASKAGYKTLETEISWAIVPSRAATKTLIMERL